jgi:hypothetical protein
MALGIRYGDAIGTSTSPRIRAARTPATTRTGALLTCGLVAGPFYLAVGALQLFLRPGYDPTCDDLSLLSNGPLGWVQITNFLLSGLLVMLGAAGMRQALRQSRGGTWGPRLLGLYGLGLVGAGCFRADPAHGFPAGTPATAHAMSWHGVLHFVSGGLGFLALVAACFVFARRFAARGEDRWAGYSQITGVLFLAAFVGIAMGSNGSGMLLSVVTLAFTAAVVLGWAWISALVARLLAA